MKLLVTSTSGTYETTVRRELDSRIETPDDVPRILSLLIEHLLTKEIIQPEELGDILNTYRTYTKAPS